MNFDYLISGRRDFYAVIRDGIPSHFNTWSTPGGQDPKTLNMWDVIFRHDSLDTVPPAAVTDLAVSLVAGVGVRLDFTSPGGDGNTGTAAEYQIKFAKAPIVDFVKRWDAGTQTGWPDLRDPLPYSDTALYAKAKAYLSTEISFWASDNVTGEPAPVPSGTAVAHTLDIVNTAGKLESNAPYYFAMVSYDKTGNVSGLSNVVPFTTGMVSGERKAAPEQGASLANAPNPFNPSTIIRYAIPSAGRFLVQIFNSQGRLVKTLDQGVAKSGHYSVSWNGRDWKGAEAGSGVYFCRLSFGKEIKELKLVLIR